MTQIPLQLGHDEEIDRTSRVLSCIRQHVGPGAAISISAIASCSGVRYRDVQEITKYLVEERSVPIGTLWSKPYGYYLITDPYDLDRNAFQFLSRGVSNIRHGRAFLKPELAGPIVGQLDLFIVSVTPFLRELEARLESPIRITG